MNIFNRLVQREHEHDTAVGVTAPIVMDRRFAAFAAMTGGRGFRQPPKEPRRDSQGRTRGDRKRAARLRAFPELVHAA